MEVPYVLIECFDCRVHPPIPLTWFTTSFTVTVSERFSPRQKQYRCHTQTKRWAGCKRRTSGVNRNEGRVRKSQEIVLCYIQRVESSNYLYRLFGPPTCASLCPNRPPTIYHSSCYKPLLTPHHISALTASANALAYRQRISTVGFNAGLPHSPPFLKI